MVVACVCFCVCLFVCVFFFRGEGADLHAILSQADSAVNRLVHIVCY